MDIQSRYGDWICSKALFTCSLLAEGVIFILPALRGYHHIVKRPRSKAAEGAFTEGFGNGESLNNLVIARECYQITVYISRSWQPRNTEVVTATWVIYCYSSHAGRNCATKRKNQESFNYLIPIVVRMPGMSPCKISSLGLLRSSALTPTRQHLSAFLKTVKEIAFGGTISALLKSQEMSYPFKLPFISSSNNC